MKRVKVQTHADTMQTLMSVHHLFYMQLGEHYFEKNHTVKPNKNFYKNMKIYDELKRSVM